MLQKLITELTYEVSVPINFNSLKENTVVLSISYSQRLEQTITMFHFTGIICCSGTDFEQSYCNSLLLLILKPDKEQEKKPNL